MTDPGRAFEAPDLIEVMDEAVRYNAFLLDQLIAWSEPDQRILDFGAGNGRFVRRLADAGRVVHALEPDAALRSGIANDAIPTHATLDELAADSYDGIYSLNVLEHIPDDEAALRGCHRALRPNGRLLLYVPAFQLLYSANDARVGHLRRYRLAGLRDLATAAGFHVTSARYVDCFGFAAALAYRLVGSRDGDLQPSAVRFYDRFVFPVSRFLDGAVDGWFGKNLLLTATARED